MDSKFEKIAAKYKPEIEKTASELIQINSQSLDEGNVARYVEEKMKSLGYDDVVVDKYGNVFGTVKGAGGGSSVTLNCHMDVVDAGDPARWKHPPYSGEIAEGRIWGRGASDTKGTMAIQIYTPIMLKNEGLLPKGDVVTAAVVTEEIAGFGSMAQARDEYHLTDYAVIGEASENDIVIASKGRCCIVVTITGKSCHASLPHLGKNPFDFLAQLLPELQKVEMGKDEIFGSSSMSATRIESSELGSNIIPNQIVLYLDYRQSTSDTLEIVQKKVEDAVAKCHVEGVSAKVEVLYFPLKTWKGWEDRGFQGEHPFYVDPKTPYIVQAKKAIESAVGHEIKTKNWAFATDTGHYARKGVKCLGYSPAEIKLCHTTEDSISCEMMFEGTVGYLALVASLANTDK